VPIAADFEKWVLCLGRPTDERAGALGLGADGEDRGDSPELAHNSPASDNPTKNGVDEGTRPSSSRGEARGMTMNFIRSSQAFVGDTQARGRRRSPLLKLYMQSIFGEGKKKSAWSFCRLRRQTAPGVYD
jgi:hypothetical protein